LLLFCCCFGAVAAVLLMCCCCCYTGAWVHECNEAETIYINKLIQSHK
jgi:hypothetical protein